MKPRQLSDAIHEEVGGLNEQISDVLWEIIRSPDGMKSEITETMRSVYAKLLRSKQDENVKSSGCDPKRIRKDYDHKSNIASTNKAADDISDIEVNEPPGFSQTNEVQTPMIPLHKLPTEEQQNESLHQSQKLLENDSSGAEHKEQVDDSDDDLDAPPGFC